MAAVDMLEKNHNSKAETISKQSIGNFKKIFAFKKKDINLMVNIQTLDKLSELRGHYTIHGMPFFCFHDCAICGAAFNFVHTNCDAGLFRCSAIVNIKTYKVVIIAF